MTPKETGFYLNIKVGDTPEVSQKVPIEKDRRVDVRVIREELEQELQNNSEMIAVVATPEDCYISVRNNALEYSRKKLEIPLSTSLGLTMSVVRTTNRMHFSIPASGCYKDGKLWTSMLELEGILPNGEPVKIALVYEPPEAPIKVE